MRIWKTFLVTVLAVAIAGCAADDPNRRAKAGAAIGAVTGAVIGHQINSDKGKIFGAAVGAMTGAVVGNYMDKQEQDFDQALEKEQRQHEIQIERMKDDTLKLNLASEVSFAFDSAQIKDAFHPTLDKLASVINKYDRTVVHVVGHTDSIGPAPYNLALSKRRADSVAGYLISRGVSAARLRTEGRGESEPRDTNTTEAGRQLNRRVEIYIKPIVEGQEQRAYQSPQY